MRGAGVVQGVSGRATEVLFVPIGRDSHGMLLLLNAPLDCTEKKS